MTAPSWQGGQPEENLSSFRNNADAARSVELRATAAERNMPTSDELCRWHSRLYAGCDVPVAGYVGHFRGDPAVPELIDYEVGLGARLKDGNLEKMGVWARQSAVTEMEAVLRGLHAVFAELDARLPVGKPPTTPDEVLDSDQLHGSRPRRMSCAVHPFANGNGRDRQAACRLHLPAVRAADVPAYQAAAGERGLHSRQPATRWGAHPTS